MIVFNFGGGEVRYFVGNWVMMLKFLGGEIFELCGWDCCEVLVNWFVLVENFFFVKNFVNIVWVYFYGCGIINEVDDVWVSNLVVNFELFEVLVGKIVEYDYDFKKIVCDICMLWIY